MKLNMGCGHNKREGYVNVDMSPVCNPDVVWDLETLPWPWQDNSVDGVLFNHSLEHLGQIARVFLGMMKELYRVCRDGAEIEINVPHPRHDNFIVGSDARANHHAGYAEPVRPRGKRRMEEDGSGEHSAGALSRCRLQDCPVDGRPCANRMPTQFANGRVQRRDDSDASVAS